METLAYTYAQTLAPTAPRVWRSSQWLTWHGLGLLLILTSLSAHALPAAANRRVATPNGGCLNVRSGPGMQYEIVRCVASGTALPVTLAQGSWVQLADGNWTFGPYTLPGGSTGTGGRLPCPGLDGQPVLDLGSRGASVIAVQKGLQQLGYSPGAFGADGIYGPMTKAAVERFQKDYNLQIDGRVGPATWFALEKALGGSSSPAPSPPATGNGSAGPGSNEGVPVGDRVLLNPVDANAEIVASTTVRFGPTQDSEASGETLRPGTTVTVLETLNDWHRLKGNSLTLWVPAGTLQQF